VQKISGIIPSNSRLTSVDLSKATPTRRGHPNVGQPEVELRMRGATPKTILREASGAYSQVMNLKNKNRSDSADAIKIQDEFFNTRLNTEIKQGIEASREEMIDQTVPVTEEVTEEVGTNLSVVA
jgi:hypothetical protein